MMSKGSRMHRDPVQEDLRRQILSGKIATVCVGGPMHGRLLKLAGNPISGVVTVAVPTPFRQHETYTARPPIGVIDSGYTKANYTLDFSGFMYGLLRYEGWSWRSEEIEGEEFEKVFREKAGSMLAELSIKYEKENHDGEDTRRTDNPFQ